MEKIKVMLVEDNRLLRESISKILSLEPDIEVITASTSSIFESFNSNGNSPDVLLLDMALKDQNCFEIMKSLIAKSPNLKVIAHDVTPDYTDAFNFIQTGGVGLLLSDASIDDFSQAVRKVASGEKVLPNELFDSLFTQIFANRGEGTSSIEESLLTTQEKKIVSLIAEGYANKEIALQLNLSTHTVKSHVHNILSKLGLNSRFQILNYTKE
ncbi:MAG: response regulator transcription factor [Bacteroidetes bacterium]|nr:response regulator transcription factor [Bacteroidota bacterium]